MRHNKTITILLYKQIEGFKILDSTQYYYSPPGQSTPKGARTGYYCQVGAEVYAADIK